MTRRIFLMREDGDVPTVLSVEHPERPEKPDVVFLNQYPCPRCSQPIENPPDAYPRCEFCGQCVDLTDYLPDPDPPPLAA